MRPSHLRLLSMVPREGIRLTDLAQRAGMTKQALGEFVAALENAGYVDLRVDPGDRRARLAQLTPAGVRQRAATDAAIVAAEKEWEDRIGTRRWAAFREVLAEIGRDLD
jgi:DNA-binding MarR family transcriptional regulator